MQPGARGDERSCLYPNFDGVVYIVCAFSKSNCSLVMANVSLYAMEEGVCSVPQGSRKHGCSMYQLALS